MAGVARAVDAKSPKYSERNVMVITEPPPECVSIRTARRRLVNAVTIPARYCASALRGRRIRIGAKNVAQSELQRLEVRLVRLPFLGRAAVNRLADLLRTRRPHGTLRLVERKARRLERQAAIVEQRPD